VLHNLTFVAVKTQVMVFWVMTPCSNVVGYHPSSQWRWKQDSPLKFGILPCHSMVSQPRRPWLEFIT